MESLYILVIVTIVLFGGYVFPWIRDPREKGLKPIIQANCSLNTNIYGFNMHGLPGASRVSLYDGFMVISNFKKLILNMADIEEIYLNKNTLSSDSLILKVHNKIGKITISSSKSKEIYDEMSRRIEYFGSE